MSKLVEGKALFENQSYQEAIDVLSEFLNTNKGNADALYYRAISYRKIGDFDNSIDDLTAILTRLPEEPSLLCERGITYFNKKDIKNSLLDMDKAVAIEPNNPYRYSSRAYIRANVDVKGAIEDYQKAIELDPKDEISHNNLGLLHENSGKINHAKKHFAEADKISGYKSKKGSNIQENKSIEPPKEYPSILKTITAIFNSKDVRKEYFIFLKSFFRAKN